MGARLRAVAPPTEAPLGLMICQPRPHGEDDDEALLLGAAPWGALPIVAAPRGLLRCQAHRHGEDNGCAADCCCAVERTAAMKGERDGRKAARRCAANRSVTGPDDLPTAPSWQGRR
jgi:hypothetical protein